MIQKTETTTYYDVVGIGNAIVDVLAKVGDRFLTERNLPKSCMTLLNAQDAGKIYADIVDIVYHIVYNQYIQYMWGQQ